MPITHRQQTKMCFTIHYICPCCRTRSGKWTIHTVHRGDCPGVVERDRFMEGEHLDNWFCATDNCGYSERSQMMAYAEDRAILEAQKMGKALPDDLVGDISSCKSKFKPHWAPTCRSRTAMYMSNPYGCRQYGEHRCLERRDGWQRSRFRQRCQQVYPGLGPGRRRGPDNHRQPSRRSRLRGRKGSKGATREDHFRHQRRHLKPEPIV